MVPAQFVLARVTVRADAGAQAPRFVDQLLAGEPVEILVHVVLVPRERPRAPAREPCTEGYHRRPSMASPIASTGRPSSRRTLKLVGVAVLVIAAVAAVLGFQRVRALRVKSASVRTAALALDGELRAVQEAWIVDQFDGAKPDALALAALRAEERVARGDFADATTEEIALSIRVGAALRDAGELDAATARLQRALRAATSVRSGLLDEFLGRTAHDPDHAANARVELARVQLARDDVDTALQLALEAWNAPRTPAALEKRTTVISDRALLVAEIHGLRGDHARAAEFARIAVDEAPPRDRSHAHVRWSALRFLALADQRAGHIADAIELHRTALAAARWAFVDDDPRTAASRYELAYLLHDEGPRFADEALREYAASLEVRLARARGDSDRLSTHQSNYALLLKQTGRLAEAEPIATSALEMYRRLEPGDRAGTATMMNNIGTLRHALGDRAGADAMLVEALAMRRRVFPSGHPDVAQSLQNLAWLRQNELEYDEAVVLGREAVEILTRVADTDSLDFAIALDNLGGALTDTKEYVEAESLTRRALAIEERLIDGDHQTRAQTLDNLGVILYRLDRFEESEERLQSALAMRRALYGMDHPDVAATRRHLGWVAEDDGRREAAIEHYRAALAALDGVAADPELRAEVGTELADCLLDSGDVERAFDVYRTTLTAALNDPTRCAWPIADASEGVARCASSLVRAADVERELERAAEIALSTDGFFLHARARTVEALCGLYDAWPHSSADRARARTAASSWRARLDEADSR